MSQEYLFLIKLRRCLRGNRALNIDALSLVYTEMLFRPWYQRGMERVLAVLKLAIGMPVGDMTLGHAQIKIAIWQSIRPLRQLQIICCTLSLEQNYLVCENHVNSLRPLPSDLYLLTKYNGRPTIAYARKFLVSRARFEELCARGGVPFHTAVQDPSCGNAHRRYT